MTIYSHSRLSCFEQCPQMFKFKYIDKVETEVEESVEAFLGSRTHETLEKLYRDLQYQKENTLDDLLDFLNNEWDKNWNDSIVIVKKGYGPDNYLKMAEKFITDYYNRYKPFDQGKTISLGDCILINLDESGEYTLQGFIDRLVEVKDGFYEIHDYKTNLQLPLPEYIENDRQLGLYSIGVKDRYLDVEDISLIWHFLAYDKEIKSIRNSWEIEELKHNTIQLINKIECEEKYATKPSALCNWCNFKPVCRQWSHLYKLEGKPANEYLNDDGVKLVNRYAELQNQKKQLTLDLYAEIEKLEEAVIHYAEKESIDVVFGSNNKVKIKTSQRYSCPSKHSREREKLEQLLREHGKWDEVAQLDTNAINKIIQEKKWDSKILDALKEYVKQEQSIRLYLSKIKGE